MSWLFGAPLLAASLHITEEFFLPGGFADWDRRYRPAFARSITMRLHVIMNGLLLVLCYDIWALRRSLAGALLWLVIAALFFSNAIWHARGAWKTRSYSPGMVTGLLLYVPLCVYGYVHFLRSAAVSVGAAAAAFVLGAAYPLVSTLLHRWRTAKAES